MSGSSGVGVDGTPWIPRGGRHAPKLGRGAPIDSSIRSASSGDPLPISSHVRSVTPYDRCISATISLTSAPSRSGRIIEPSNIGHINSKPCTGSTLISFAKERPIRGNPHSTNRRVICAPQGSGGGGKWGDWEDWGGIANVGGLGIRSCRPLFPILFPFAQISAVSAVSYSSPNQVGKKCWAQ